MTMTENDYLATALRAMRAGVSVLPPRQDGSKRPVSAWKHYQAERADEEKIREWYANGRTGVGVVPGAVSGGLELFEFDEPHLAESFIDAASAAGMRDLVLRIMAGYCELTPGGGVHWFYRCSEVGNNTKLARRPEPTEDNPHGVKVLIETRGEGGFAIVAPSNGHVHPSGGAYERISGDWDSVTTITPDERRALFDLARTFDQMPPPAPVERFDSMVRVGDRPGDRFAEATSWADILKPHGWDWVYSQGEVGYWRRPGKDYGVSATTNYKGSDLLYVFSSSTEFEPEQTYTKFGAYTVLNHGGDYKAAATALSEQQPGGVLVRHEPAFEVDEETGEIKRHYEIIDAPDYVTRPAPRWLVHSIITEGAFFSVYGPPASFKTFWALDLMASIAAGINFHRLPVRQGPCLYVAAEGAGGLMARLKAWQKARGVPLPRDLKILPGVVSLMNPEAVARLIVDIQSFGTPFAAVMFDTWSRSIAGADENTQKDMSTAVDHAGRLKTALNTTVGMVHHGTKGTGSLRGSSVLDGALDTIIRITASEQAVTVHNEKQKDGAEFPDMAFRRVIVPLYDAPARDDGRIVLIGAGANSDTSSVVLERMDADEEQAQKRDAQIGGLTASQRLTVVALESFGPEGANRREWLDGARTLHSEELSRQAFYKQVDTLLRRGIAKIVTERAGQEIYVVDGRYRGTIHE
jgi:hypothetical protein